MISQREWISICLAGVCLGGLAIAQEGGGAASSGSGGSAGANSASGSTTSGTEQSGTSPSGTKSGSKGKGGKSESPDSPETPEGAPETLPPGSTTPGGTLAPKPGGSVDPFIPTTPKAEQGETANGPGASSSFGTPGEDTTGAKPAEGEAADGGPSGPSSAFGPGDSTATQGAPPSFTLPGFFGGPATTYVGGQGRLARPRFRFKVTTAQGYDDNVLQTPDDPIRFPDVQVLIDPGTPDTVTFVPVTTTTYERAFADEIVYFRPVTKTTFRPVVTKGRPPVIETIRAPEPQERTGSLVSRIGIRLDAQQVTRRSLFTLDANGSLDRYWDRPGATGNDDYSGSVSIAYQYNITPRLQASFTSNVAYISQPDYTRINTPDRLGASDLVNGLGRLNLVYRITPRWSTTLSVGTNAVVFVNRTLENIGGASANGNSFETTFSAEAKYLWKPRYSLLAEFRHVLINYSDVSSLNSSTELLLLGAELKLSSKLAATLRLGHSLRVFDESGDTYGAPYGEMTIGYRIGPTSSVQWNSRFGYEEPPSPGSETLGYRTTVQYFKSFTPRLTLSAGITGLSRNTSYETGDSEANQTIDANVGLQYRYNRQLTLNASFSYTKQVTTSGIVDYDRSRIFIGADYEF